MALLMKLGLDREGFVKTNLIQTLVDCVKELQLKHAAERSESLTNNEPTNALCYCLEAMFIHGLKNPFLKSMSSVLNTSRENQIPQPSFWEFVLIFCHQDVILQINLLRHINTDIGRCRAWLRIILNDGLLISYMQLIMMDKRMLKEYYKPSAFLRDTERCDLAKSYLYGIESYNFQLACNSSLLNSWNSTPLSLVGLWTPSDAIVQGVDVAENMEAKDLQALSNIRQQSNSPPDYSHLPHEAFRRAPLLEEDAALRLILSSKGSTSATKYSASASNTSFKNTESEVSQTTYLKEGLSPSKPSSGQSTKSSTSIHPSGETKLEISASNHPIKPFSSSGPELGKTDSEKLEGLGSASNNVRNNHDGNLVPHDTVNVKTQRAFGTETDGVSIPLRRAAGTPQEDEGSYAALFQSYSRSDSAIGTPIGVGSPVTIGSFLQSGHSFLSFRQNQSETTVSSVSFTEPIPAGDHRKSTTSDCDFQIVAENRDDSSNFEQTEQSAIDLPVTLRDVIQKIPNETGLDAQNYRCKQCNRPIGMLYGAARVCGFSGNYYCGDCHLDDDSVIPSRILMNWDFTRFSISRKARDFLDEISDKPIFDLNKINPKLYQEVEECAELLNLRTQLNSISIYLMTCKGSLIEELNKEFWMKEHLFRELHTYSISDLLNIPNRQLITTFSKLVVLGSTHIKSCVICRQKGFICEICRDIEVIFPFDLDIIFKCMTCGAVYHNKCMNNNIQCPRCDRWKFE